MIEVVKVSSKGQLVIPESFRKELGIKEGAKLVILEKNKRLILEKEEDFLNKLKIEEIEDLGWLKIGEKSLKKVWDNKKDDETWNKYL